MRHLSREMVKVPKRHSVFHRRTPEWPTNTGPSAQARQYQGNANEHATRVPATPLPPPN